MEETRTGSRASTSSPHSVRRCRKEETNKMNYSPLSTVYLVTLEDGNYGNWEQTIYVITPKRENAIRIAKERTELSNPKLSSVYKHRLYELEQAEREEFVGRVALFEPELSMYV